jgi:hypothetical protein
MPANLLARMAHANQCYACAICDIKCSALLPVGFADAAHELNVTPGAVGSWLVAAEG